MIRLKMIIRMQIQWRHGVRPDHNSCCSQNTPALASYFHLQSRGRVCLQMIIQIKGSQSKLWSSNSKKSLYWWLMHSVFMKIHKKIHQACQPDQESWKHHWDKQRSTRSLSLSSSLILVSSMIEMNKAEPEAATTIPSTRSFLLNASTAPCGKKALLTYL